MKLGDMVTYAGFYGIVVKVGPANIYDPGEDVVLVVWHGSGFGPEWEFIDLLEVYRES